VVFLPRFFCRIFLRKISEHSFAFVVLFSSNTRLAVLLLGASSAPLQLKAPWKSGNAGRTRGQLLKAS
jgi:hypothetical protein